MHALLGDDVVVVVVQPLAGPRDRVELHVVQAAQRHDAAQQGLSALHLAFGERLALIGRRQLQPVHGGSSPAAPPPSCQCVPQAPQRSHGWPVAKDGL